MAAGTAAHKGWSSLLEQRRALVARAPVVLLRIKGVTFEGRQELVQRLAPGEPVLLAKEPSNLHDAHAVEIVNLEGQQLGHVGRQLTGGFPLQECAGRVVAVAQAAGSPEKHWGASVACSPALHLLPLQQLPPSWPPQAAGLEQVFGADAWQQLQAAARRRYYGRCAVSGVPGAAPLAVLPVWGLDHLAHQVWLQELLPVAQPLADAQQALLQGASAAGRQQALQAVSQLLQWPPQQVERFVALTQRRQAQLEQQAWQLRPPDAGTLLAAAAAAGSSGSGSGSDSDAHGE